MASSDCATQANLDGVYTAIQNFASHLANRSLNMAKFDKLTGERLDPPAPKNEPKADAKPVVTNNAVDTAKKR